MSTEGGDPRDESHSTGPDGAPGDSGVRADLSALDGPRVRTRPGRRRFIGRDLTSGSVPKNLWYLAWPQTVEGVFNALDPDGRPLLGPRRWPASRPSEASASLRPSPT